MRWQILLTGFTKHIESVAVSSFYRESMMCSVDHMGGVRTYNGSGVGGNESAGWVTCKELT